MDLRVILQQRQALRLSLRLNKQKLQIIKAIVVLIENIAVLQRVIKADIFDEIL